MVAALLAQRSRRPGMLLADEVSLAATVLWGQVRHESLLTLLGGGLRRLDSEWFLGEKLVCDAEAALRTVVSPPAVFGAATLPDFFDPAGAGAETDFAFSTLLFGEALAAGWPWALALRAFAGLGRGWPCGRGRGFIPERGKHVPRGSRWLSGSIASAADPDTVATLFFDEHGVVFVGCTKPVFGPAGRSRTHPAWLDHKKTRFLPEYIRLEADGDGVPIWPDGHVTDLVARRHAWKKLILMVGLYAGGRAGEARLPAHVLAHHSLRVLPAKPQELRLR